MPDFPDWQPMSFWIDDPIVGQAIAPGAGNITFGPFPSGAYRALLLGTNPFAVGGVRTVVNMQPSPSLAAPSFSWSLHCLLNQTMGVVVPLYGSHVTSIVYTGSAAGVQANVYAAMTTRDLDLFALPGRGDLLGFATRNVGIGATDTRQLIWFWGSAQLHLNLTGAPWDVRVDALDMTGVVIARPFQALAVTGVIRADIDLPGTACQLAVTNNTGVANNYDSSLVWKRSGSP